MKKLTTICITLAALAFADIHPELKKAIDNGDIKKAQNLRKMGVDGVYCPATLNPKNGETIYGFQNSPDNLIFSCDTLFIENYINEFCVINVSKNLNFCNAFINSYSTREEHPRWTTLLSKNACKIDTSMCQNMLNYTPTLSDDRFNLFRDAKEHHLDVYESFVDSIYYEDVIKKITTTKKQCINDVKTSSEYRWATKKEQARLLKNAQKYCKTTTTDSVVSEEVKKSIKRRYYPLTDWILNSRAAFYEATITRPRISDLKKFKELLFSMPFDSTSLKYRGGTSEWEEYYEEGEQQKYSENAFLKKIQENYVKGTMTDFSLLGACRNYPNIDKVFKEKFGIEDAFDCKNVLDKYNKVCSASTIGELFEYPGFSGKYACTDSVNISKITDTDARDLFLNRYCNYATEGSEVIKDSVKFICKTNRWEFAYTDSLVDFRDDDRVYKAVKIGEQIWMAENLDYATESGSAPNSYGRLYQGYAAQEACPIATGWHLPSKEEWERLFAAVGNGIIFNFFLNENKGGFWMSSPDTKEVWWIETDGTAVYYDSSSYGGDRFVRCVKDND